MSWGTPDVYYQPEHFGLTVVKEIDAGEAYEFDLYLLWKHEDGRFFYASDSGCSCPSPFEDYTSLEDLTEVRSMAELDRELPEPGGGWVPESFAAERIAMLRAATEAGLPVSTPTEEGADDA